MKRIVCSAAILFALMTTACSGGDKEVSELPQIDVNAEYPEKEICLQDVAEVSYVPLETTDEVLLGNSFDVEEFSSRGIVCVSDNKIFFFHPDGKSHMVFNRQGQGPGEYSYGHYATVDWKRKEIYVHDVYQKTMLVYSMDGKFKHQFGIDFRVRQNDLLCDNEGHIVLYKEKQGHLVHGKIEPPYRPIVRVSQEGGKIDSLSHQQDYYTAMRVKAELADGSPWTLDVPIPALAKLNGEVYISEVASDTIYRLQKSALEPFATRTPFVKESEGEKYLLMLQGITPHHYHFRLQAKELSGGNASGMTIKLSDDKSKEVMYDVRTGEAFCPKFINRDHASEFFYDGLTFNGCDAHTAYLKLEAFDLIEALEAGELSGELKTIAQGLKEDDNPVLMMVKFKE